MYKILLHRISNSFSPYQWDLRQTVIDSRACPQENCSKNNRNSNHTPLCPSPVCLVLFPAASTRGLNSRMETNRPFAMNKDRTRKRRKRESGKRGSYVHCRQWNETKARSAKTEIKEGKKEKIRHTPQCATKRNDALSKVARIELVAVLIRGYWSNRAVVCVLNSIPRCF